MLYLKHNKILQRGDIFKAFDTQYRVIGVANINNQILYDLEELDGKRKSTVVLKGHAELITILDES